MLTNNLYNTGLRLALKTMKNNEFLANEALQNALLSCHNSNNWYKPFVMQVIYNKCLDIYNRGYYSKHGEKN